MGRGLRVAFWAGGLGVLLYALLLGDGGWLRVASLNAEVRELESELEARASTIRSISSNSSRCSSSLIFDPPNILSTLPRSAIPIVCSYC